MIIIIIIIINIIIIVITTKALEQHKDIALRNHTMFLRVIF